MDMQNVTELNEIAAKDFDGIIDFCTMTFYGKCGTASKNLKFVHKYGKFSDSVL